MSTHLPHEDTLLLREIRDLLEPINIEHQHKFAIPVEWHNDIFDWAFKGDGSGAKPIYRYFVTKLRCECGEEQDRE